MNTSLNRVLRLLRQDCQMTEVTEDALTQCNWELRRKSVNSVFFRPLEEQTLPEQSQREILGR